MLAQDVQVDNHGRLLLPVKIRKFSGIMPGSSVRVYCNDNGEVNISTAKQGLERARALWKKYDDGSSLLDELFKMRREDAAKE